MGNTVTFYSADPTSIVAAYVEEDMDKSIQLQQSFVQADFSMHLYLDEDLDRLCQIMKRSGFDLPEAFIDLVVETVWEDDDECPGYVWLLDDRIKGFAHATKEQVLDIAAEWAEEFEGTDDEAVRALRELRTVCRDATKRKQRVLVYQYPY